MFDTREPITGTPPQPKAPTPPAPRPLKAGTQTWQRTFRGAANGVTFQLRIIRQPNGHLSARYQATPGQSSGWHLEGQLRDDNTFTLKGTENNAEFQGKISPDGKTVTSSFTNKTSENNFTLSEITMRMAAWVKPAQPDTPSAQGNDQATQRNSIEKVVEAVTGRVKAINGITLSQEEVDRVKDYLRKNISGLDFDKDAYTFPGATTASDVPFEKRRNMFFKVADAAKRLGDPYPELVAAQWYIESNAGTSNAAHSKNNLFGIMKPGGITEGLRTYSSPLESLISRVLIPIANQHHIEYQNYYNSDTLNGAFKQYMHRYAPADIPQATAGDAAYPDSILRVLSSMYGGDEKAKAIMNRGPYGKLHTAQNQEQNENTGSASVYWPMRKFKFGDSTIATKDLATRLSKLRSKDIKIGSTNIPTAEFTADSSTLDYRGGVGVHTGWDFNFGFGADDLGMDIFSVTDGKVDFAGVGIFGRQAAIYHPSLKLYSRYGHLSHISVQAGENVKAGQSIGKLGGSGISGGILRERKFTPHLHLEFLKPSESTGKRSNKELQSFWGGQSVNQVLANFEDPYKILVKMGARYVS